MSATEKKRLRNKYASCVSRLKKKLYICHLLRDLEQTRHEAAGMVHDLAGATRTIQALREENVLLRRQAGMPDLTAETRGGGSLTERGARPVSISISPLQGGAPVYCLCRTEASDTMIQCDSCTDWFHTQCVGLSSEEARTLPQWVCPACLTV
jgi:hypothetical protein